MDTCTGSFMNKLTQTMDMIFGTCVPKSDQHEDEDVLNNGKQVEDDTYKKEELKQLVGIFSEAAQVYIPCTLIESDRKLSAMYKLDNMLKTLTVKIGEELRDIPLKKVEGVYSFEDLVEDINYDFVFKDKTINTLTASEKERFVLIEHLDESNNVRHTILLVEKLGNNDPFITCLSHIKFNNHTMGFGPNNQQVLINLVTSPIISQMA